MSTFEEYAALARELSTRRRTAERRAAAEAGRLRALRDTAAGLDDRLAGQEAWLRQLGMAIGQPAPALSDLEVPPGGSAFGDRHRKPPGRAWLALPATGGSVEAVPPQVTSGDPAEVTSGDAAETVVPLRRPSSDPGRAPSADLAQVARAGPEPARSVEGVTLEPVPEGAGSGPPTDLAGELERAGRRADDADRHGRRAELLAGQPRLLPGWSPLLRAVVVYFGCAVVGLLPMVGLVLAFDAGRVDAFTLGAWISAGLPATAFLVGFLLLGRYGRPVLGGEPAPRHPRVGFLICFLLVPLTYCGYLALTGPG